MLSRRRIATHHLLQIFGENVAFEVHAIARLARMQRRLAVGMWNDRHRYNTVLDRGNRQADAVDSEGSFIYHVPVEFSRYAYFQPPVIVADGIERYELARPVDVTLDDMTAEPASRE